MGWNPVWTALPGSGKPFVEAVFIVGAFGFSVR
jgi:hypothetical protein